MNDLFTDSYYLSPEGIVSFSLTFSTSQLYKARAV